MAGLVLGVESVPDGLAAGVLAGGDPVFGLYGHLFGMVGGALFTSTALMAVQSTGAMSLIVADVDLAGRADPARSLFTLAIVTGVLMIVAGVLRFGSYLRFVSNSVMTGFVTAVGVNIVLGQLDNLTGYSTEGANRVVRTIDLFRNAGSIDLPSVAVGALTIALILALGRTRLGALGLVVAVVVGSAAAAVLAASGRDVALVGDVAVVPSSLPRPELPVLSEIPTLLVPAASLAFVGLVQGAGVSAGLRRPDDDPPAPSQDFVAQGAGNIVAGVFQGMPVGGAMSASTLVSGAGARSRAALLFAGAAMALVLVLLAPAVERVAMPALAGLLMVTGARAVKPARVMATARTGKVPLTVMTITFVLTLLIPLQYAVLVGVGCSVLLFVVGQSTRLVTRRLEFLDDGRVREVAPPDVLSAGEVVVLQPYGAVFFATTTVLIAQMPAVDDDTRSAVVILRIRGADAAGSTLLEALRTYASLLGAHDSKLVLVTDNDRLIRQLHATGTARVLGAENIYRSTEYIGETVRRANADAVAWVTARREAAP